ncbi:MAG: hypothetical protein G8237_03200 [Magnetococcales bacterium]|nr:hypothetical protein [Magnetococcales bacterium]NGZ05341.1 hypothetical protein [Magnetococcales bacterium]
MKRHVAGRIFLWMLTLLCLSAGHSAQAEGKKLMVLANRETPEMDLATLRKVFLGKVIRVNGMAVTPVNLSSGNPARSSFLGTVLEQTEEKYVNYWTVRRYIGQGSPPREVKGESEMVDYLRVTPGAVGYIEEFGTPGDLQRLSVPP